MFPEMPLEPALHTHDIAYGALESLLDVGRLQRMDGFQLPCLAHLKRSNVKRLVFRLHAVGTLGPGRAVNPATTRGLNASRHYNDVFHASQQHHGQRSRL